MEQLRLKSNHLISEVPTVFTRALSHDIDWTNRLIGLIGPRGVGKTTMLLQQAKSQYGVDPQALYFSMDDIYLAGQSLRQFASEFRSKGGRHLFIDDIHKHPQWSLELKNIYETLPDIKVTFAGSSIIEMVKHYANLSQRAHIFNLTTLSFREYLALEGIAQIPRVDLQTILRKHIEIATELVPGLNPTLHLNDYFTKGFYPIRAAGYESFKRKLEAIVQETIEVDMNYLEGYDSRNTYKIKQLVNIIAQNAPFKPNLVKISEAIGVHRNTLIGYFFHLERTKLISLLYPSGENVSILQKPERVYLGNPNLAQLFGFIQPSRDTLVSNLAVSLLSALFSVQLVQHNMIDVDGQWRIAIPQAARRVRKPKSGGDYYTLIDGYEIGSANRIPLWLMGLLY